MPRFVKWDGAGVITDRHDPAFDCSRAVDVDGTGRRVLVAVSPPTPPFSQPPNAAHIYDVVSGAGTGLFDALEASGGPLVDAPMSAPIAMFRDGHAVVGRRYYPNGNTSPDDELLWNAGINSFGIKVCSNGTASSRGVRASLLGRRSLSITANDARLIATQLPRRTFGIFLVGDQLTAPTVLGAGHLCLQAPFGLFNGPGQVKRSGTSGTITLPIDLTALPTARGRCLSLRGRRGSSRRGSEMGRRPI